MQPLSLNAFLALLDRRRTIALRQGTRFSAPALALAGLALSLSATSCADLTEVAKFAACAKSASTGYADIVTDFAGSAARRADDLRDTQKPDAEADVQKYKALQPAMLAAQKPLVDYITALAAIATDTPAAAGKGSSSSSSTAGKDSTATADAASSTSDSAGADAAGDPTEANLEKLGMSSTQATAALGLASKIAAALSAGYRSNKAGKAIHDCNPELQDYLKGLEQIVGTDYPQLLDTEKISVEGHYSDLLGQYGKTEPLAAMTTSIQEKQDLAAIEKRRRAATAYLKILTDIGQGHQKLFDAGDKVTAIQLAAIVEPYVADIEKQSVAVQKAF